MSKMKLLSLMLSKLRNIKPAVETIEWKFSIDAWKYLLCVCEHAFYTYEGVSSRNSILFSF